MVRSFNRSVLDPAMLTLAGRRLWYASVIEHRGRMSGRGYRTPVVAIKATVHGQTYDVTEPVVIDAATAESQLSAPHRFVYHRSHVDEYVKFVLAQ